MQSHSERAHGDRPPSASSIAYRALGRKGARHGLVFLHGWKQGGANMRDSLRTTLGDDGLEDTTVYCLTAPHSVDDDGEERQWFAYRFDNKLTFTTEEMLQCARTLSPHLRPLLAEPARRARRLGSGLPPTRTARGAQVAGPSAADHAPA
jgi:hypothetical protein